MDYLLAGLTKIFGDPGRGVAAGGVDLQVEHNNAGRLQLVRFTPSADLKQRLLALPQGYLAERGVLERMQLTPDRGVAEARLAAALNDSRGSSWPDTHYLSPLHPVLDWVADRSLAGLHRDSIFAVHGNVQVPSVVVQGIVTNKRGQNIAVSHVLVQFMGSMAMPQPFDSPGDLFDEIGLSPSTIGRPVVDPEQYQSLVGKAVAQGRQYMEGAVAESAMAEAEQRTEAWVNRMDEWERGSTQGATQTRLFKQSKAAVQAERVLAREMKPDRTYVRPLLVVVPQEGR